MFRMVQKSGNHHIQAATSGETDGGAGGAAAPLAGHFEVFGPPVTTLLILLSDL